MTMKPRPISELAGELKAGRFPSPEEWRSARELEGRLIPDGTVMPEEGAIYVCSEPCSCSFQIHWDAATTTGGETTIPKGEEVRIGKILERKQIAIAAAPVDFSRAEEIARSQEHRTLETQTVFNYVIYTRNFIAKFQRK